MLGVCELSTLNDMKPILSPLNNLKPIYLRWLFVSCLPWMTWNQSTYAGCLWAVPLEANLFTLTVCELSPLNNLKPIYLHWLFVSCLLWITWNQSTYAGRLWAVYLETNLLMLAICELSPLKPIYLCWQFVSCPPWMTWNQSTYAGSLWAVHLEWLETNLLMLPVCELSPLNDLRPIYPCWPFLSCPPWMTWNQSTYTGSLWAVHLEWLETNLLMLLICELSTLNDLKPIYLCCPFVSCPSWITWDQSIYAGHFWAVPLEWLETNLFRLAVCELSTLNDLKPIYLRWLFVSCPPWMTWEHLLPGFS